MADKLYTVLADGTLDEVQLAANADLAPEYVERIEDLEENRATTEQVTELDTTLRALIAQEVAKYLPLSGGTMTRAVEHINNAAVVGHHPEFTAFFSNPDAWWDGAFLLLNNVTHPDPDSAGVAGLRAYKPGGQYTDFNVKPDGTAILNNGRVVTETEGTANAVRDLYSFTDDEPSNVPFPNGGTWRYWYVYAGTTGGSFYALNAGTIAGGSSLYISEPRYAGFAIRIK